MKKQIIHLATVGCFAICHLLPIVIGTNILHGQNIGINPTGATPNTKALLDVDAGADNLGLLIPRLTTAQRNAIASPIPMSLLIFNTTTECFEAWNQTTLQWVAFGCIGCTVPTAVSASAAPNPICEGSTLTLTGGGTNVIAWNWTGPNGFTSTLQSPTIAGITTAGAGVYTLTASNTCGSAAPVSTASVSVSAAPTTANAGPDQNLPCGNSTTTLAGNTPIVGTGAWSVVSGTATITTPSSPTSGVTDLVVPGTATLRWTISNSPCTPSTDDVIITTSVCCTPSITAGATTTGTGSLCFGGSGNTFTMTKPAGVTSGNVLIAGITQNGSASSVTPPSGWIFIASNTGSGPNYVYYKVAGASEPASYTWTFDVPTYPSGVITNFTGTFCSPPLDVYSTVNTSGYTASSVTTSTPNDMLVVVFCSGSGGQTWSTPAGMTADYSGGQNCTSTGIFHVIQASAGASGGKTGTPSMGDTGSAYIIALH